MKNVITGSSPTQVDVFQGMKAALAKRPESNIIRQMIAEQEKLMAGPQEGDLPGDSASLWSMRPID